MKGRKYKIVYCTPALYSAGGVERVVSGKASYFAERFDYDVTIILTEGKGRPFFFPLSDKVKVVNLGLDFEELWNASFLKKVALYLKKQYRYRRLLREELERLRPDFTITTLRREINFINDIDDGSLKIGEIHLNRENFRKADSGKPRWLVTLFASWWRSRLVGKLQQLDKFVVLTESSVAEWPELDNVVSIPDSLAFRAAERSPLDSRRVITIGRYSYEKGYDLLLKAWAVVERQCPDWTLDIYGMGDSSSYEAMASEWGIDLSRCHFNGAIKDVRKAYLQSSVFVMSSRFEGFGLVLVEAMACGVPIVSFACQSGPVEMIDDGVNGLLAAEGDYQDLADKLIRLMQSSELRMRLAENGVKRSAQYDIDKIAQLWKSLFEGLKKET